MVRNNKIFWIVRIAVLSAILTTQEEVLTFLPNIQLTQCLIAVYFYSLGFKDTIIIVLIHTLIDNLLFGSFNIIYTTAMFIGWSSLVLILFLIRKIKNNVIISLVVGLHGFIYSMCFLVVTVFLYKANFLAYFASDLIFEIILVINGFITTLLLRKPLCGVLDKIYNKGV